jgi:PAS domain S-box-containing protein
VTHGDVERARRGFALAHSISPIDDPAALARALVEVVPDACVVRLHDRTALVDPVADAAARARLERAATALDGIAHTEHRATLDANADAAAAGARSLLAVPIRIADQAAGSLVVLRRTERPFDDLDIAIVENLAQHAGLALANARLHRELAWKMAEPNHGFLDAIIENIPDMVFVKDAESLAFVRFNRAGEALLGVRREELIGKTDFDFFPADEAKFFVTKDRQTLAAKTLVEIAEEPIQTRTGTRWLHTKKVPLVDAQGVARYLLGISHDITDRKRTEVQLRMAKESAEQASRELETFANSVAQDLRAPLRGIVGFSEALLEDCVAQLDDRGREYLRRLSESANKMAVLIDDLLGLARLSRTELHRERFDLGALASSMANRLQRTEPERAAEIVIQHDLYVEGDRRLLAVVLDNLLGNAWKFTAGRDRARIELGTMAQSNARVFYVRDNGAGFDMAYADKLFGVFQRLHPDHEFSGAGIGLATVARIVRRHEGRVWAEGAVDGGATFYFTLGPE